MFFKKLKIPVTNETKEVDVLQHWIVRWDARISGVYGIHSSGQQVCEIFISEKEAKEFAESLVAAFKLVKNCHDIKSVKIDKYTK